MQLLPFETLTQFVALGLTLVAGWILGLASHSGARKWRARLNEAEAEHARYRNVAEQDLREANHRIRVLEDENARLGGSLARAPLPERHPDDRPDRY
ncbi:MAG: hypothetical protein J7500_15390 [Sphingomonas sp.]|uniref:hypothetical protein n=1 Tax=Sphingomonas sp. TaxID=28214 RepID=UPI001B1CC928|nr:hypothetical protein [Sphingomonas sp.]MBO9624091.1 hypothetical protein [Sphingomonas sp.]